MAKINATTNASSPAGSNINGRRAAVLGAPSVTDKGEGGASPRLRGLDRNPWRDFGPLIWQTFRDSLMHLSTVSLPNPSAEARFTFSARIYAMPRAILMGCQGTTLIMTRGPALIAHGADQLLIFLQIEGSVEGDTAGRRVRLQAGDVAIIDCARPFHGVATDYRTLMIVIARANVPAALLSLEPHGLVFPRDSGAARLIGEAIRALYAQAGHLTVSEAETATVGIVAMTTTLARLKLTGREFGPVRSKRKAALEYIDAHLGNARLGPGEIADAAHLSRASLYRLLAAEGGIRAVLLKRRLDEALRLMLEDDREERSLKEMFRCCGFGSASQFSRAFRARFGVPPRQYRALVRRQGFDWDEARLRAGRFDHKTLLWQQQRLNGSKPPDGPDQA